MHVREKLPLTQAKRSPSTKCRRLPALLPVLHVLVTLLAVVIALVATRGNESWTWQGITTWTAAGVLMFPVPLVHHFVCLFFGWHSGLAQPAPPVMFRRGVTVLIPFCEERIGNPS